MRCSHLLGLLAVAGALTGVAVPASEAGDGDQVVSTTPSSPPGPWTSLGTKVDPQASGVRRCAPPARAAGLAKLVAAYHRGASCKRALRIATLDQRCLALPAASAGRCQSTPRRVCTARASGGRCGSWERRWVRRVGGYRCEERRSYVVRTQWNGDVACVRRGVLVAYGYTLFSGEPVTVGAEWELRAAWANPRVSRIVLSADITFSACELGDPLREAAGPIELDGAGHVLRQGCFEKRVLRQDGTGFVRLRSVTLTRGGSDGPGAAISTRGEIEVVDSRIVRNLAEEPGGGVFAMRGATIIRSVITGNLANDDGGGVYARRGGIRVFDSVVSNNLVDGSGGALASTGDILVVRSHIDGNTTDGDGGAIYADEAGGVTVISSTVDGSTADGPGGAIFTLDGDVLVADSTLNGNRADDRGGAISGEGDVVVIGSTIARNAANAHVGGGVWARGNLLVENSTIASNYAEGQGGGLMGAGAVRVYASTVLGNISPLAASVGAGVSFEAFGSIIGPPSTPETGGDAQPSSFNCRVTAPVSLGYNLVSDATCGLSGVGDAIGRDPMLGEYAQNGAARGYTFLPQSGSPAIDAIPAAACEPPGYAAAVDRLRSVPGGPAWLDSLKRDERGVTRPAGAGCDIGAVEVEP
ncbi:MAG: hypothetical protein J7513_15555 [Solirubrobacteraceae bacterium]|nr:hypothetical protein [Solirubrobacteraceae bacterium]